MTYFSHRITFFAIQILRAFIQFSINTKILFVECEEAMNAVMDLIKPSNLGNLNEQLEEAVYSFLTQLVREEQDYKRIIGKRVLPICRDRMQKIVQERVDKKEYFVKVKKGTYDEFEEPDLKPIYIFYNSNIEIKYFKMISVLAKNQRENISIIRVMESILNDYIRDLKSDSAQRIKQKVIHILTVVASFDDF